MNHSKLRILLALAGLATLSTQAGGPRDTAPIVQLPPTVQAGEIATPMAGPNVTLPEQHEDFYAAQARARPAAPTVTTQAMVETPATTSYPTTTYRGGAHGPTVDVQR